MTIRRPRPRSGSVLLFVLVVVMMLAFSVYSFSELMLVELEASHMAHQQLQLRELAASGVEYAAARVRRLDSGSLSPHAMANVAVTKGTSQPGTVSILAEIPQRGHLPRFGMRNESARLNVNSLPLELSKRRQTRDRLTAISGITPHLAEALLDWMDSDDEPTQFGAETSWYSSQQQIGQPYQKRFESLDELLLVRGMTVGLLFGEDWNRNGLRDANEPDGNRDGVLQRGLSEFLTVTSRERVIRSDGRPRINVNSNHLASLYDAVAAEFDDNVARYLVAWRMFGPVYADEPARTDDVDPEALRLERIESAQRRLAAQLGGQIADELTPADRSRGGLDLVPRPPFKVGSLVELIGGSVRVTLNGEDTLLRSPWQSDAVGLVAALRRLRTVLTTTDDAFLPGRINVNEAPFDVLMTIPGMTESLARAIIAERARLRTGRTQRGQDDTVGWLVEKGLLTVGQLRRMGAYITTGGDVWRGVAVGRIGRVRSAVAIRFMLDATTPDPRLLSIRDLSPRPAEEFGLISETNDP